VKRSFRPFGPPDGIAWARCYPRRSGSSMQVLWSFPRTSGDRFGTSCGPELDNSGTFAHPGTSGIFVLTGVARVPIVRRVPSSQEVCEGHREARKGGSGSDRRIGSASSGSVRGKTGGESLRREPERRSEAPDEPGRVKPIGNDRSDGNRLGGTRAPVKPERDPSHQAVAWDL
jgi:hypothetical protein